MPLDPQTMWTLLRSVDDPTSLEFPADYDDERIKAEFEELVVLLEQRFGCVCYVDRGVQDGSHHGGIIIPASATAGADDITIRISNFGDLAGVALGHPGTYSEEEVRERFHPDDLRRVEDALQGLGYHVIAEHLLRIPYDGAHAVPGEPWDSWWIRYFDYI